MDFPIKAFATNLHDMSSTTETHMMERDNQLLRVVFWPPYMCFDTTHTDTLTHTLTDINILIYTHMHTHTQSISKI